MKIGFVGLGNMGSGIARNLIKAGHTLTVYNRTRSRAEELRPLGVKVAETPGGAASDAEVVITMLADDHSLEAVVLGPGNILESLPAAAVHVGMSTISVALSRRLAVLHNEKRQRYIAAPVFGRPDAAAAAKLFVVVGGAADQIERCRPLFEAIGQKTFVAGDEAFAANVFKLAGNFMITTVIESLSEAFALIRKSGLDANDFLEVLTGSLFASPVYKNYGAMIAADKFEPVGFRLPLGFKDNKLVLSAAEEVAVPMPMASLVRDRFVTAIAQGMSNSDWAAIARISAQDAGLMPDSVGASSVSGSTVSGSTTGGPKSSPTGVQAAD